METSATIPMNTTEIFVAVGVQWSRIGWNFGGWDYGQGRGGMLCCTIVWHCSGEAKCTDSQNTMQTCALTLITVFFILEES